MSAREVGGCDHANRVTFPDDDGWACMDCGEHYLVEDPDEEDDKEPAGYHYLCSGDCGIVQAMRRAAETRAVSATCPTTTVDYTGATAAFIRRKLH